MLGLDLGLKAKIFGLGLEARGLGVIRCGLANIIGRLLRRNAPQQKFELLIHSQGIMLY